MNSLIPIFVIMICSILILIELCKRTFNLNSEQNSIQNRIRQSNQILLMILSTNLFYFISAIPYCILYFNFSFDRVESNKSTLIFNALNYSNYSFNFLFYIIFSEKYRKEMINLFCIFKNLLLCKQFKSVNRVNHTYSIRKNPTSYNSEPEFQSINELSKEPRVLTTIL